MKIKLTDIVEDFDLYPRGDVDSGHVAHIVDAIEAGADIPKIIICEKTRRIVDGFHRKRAWTRALGKDGEIEVIAKHYKNEAELFLEAMRLNAGHGRNLTSYDRTIAIEKAVRLDIDPADIATALNLKVERVTAYKSERCAKLENSRRIVPLKQPIRHFAGQTMTREQSEIIPKLGGNNALFYVNQLRMLVENDMIDSTNEKLLVGLADLGHLLRRYQKKGAA